METRKLRRFIPLLLLTGLFMAGPVALGYAGEPAGQAVTAPKTEGNVYKGKISGKSKKAKTITILVGKDDDAKAMMVKFDENTKGLEFAEKGEAAIISFEKRGEDLVAIEVKQKLANLPAGVTEIQPAEMAELIALGPEKGNYFLVDSRPPSGYAEGHLPYAVSVPVAKLKSEQEAVLPASKDIQLIFYCGGVT